MVKRKRIALLVGQPEENYQNLFIQGFLKNAFESDFDVCVFAMYQKYQESPATEIGESNIFSLIEYDMFDAFVILLDTIQTPGVADLVEERLHENYDGPVICVDKESKYFTTIMTDHYTPVKQLINHLIEKHGFTDIAYLTGKEWHPHSKQRLQGFMDCMADHGLIVGVNRVFYGDFWYTSGANVAEQLLKDPDELPQAVACANDCMAIGMAEAFEKHGLHVPEDIAVIGYDALPEGQTSPKPVTSAPIPAGECGCHVIECLKAAFAGKEMPEFHAAVELFIGSSCGCHNESLVPKIELRKTWATDRSSGSFYALTNRLAEDLLIQSDMSGLMHTIFSYVYQIGDFDSFHLCLNDNWNQDTVLPDDDAGIRQYTKCMRHILQCGQAGKDGVNLEAVFERKELLPDLFVQNDIPKAYFFTPLYFEERSFGYAAISYGNKAQCYDETYRLWLHCVMQGMEIFRRFSTMQRQIAQLQAGQTRDSGTGFYNYKGFMDNAFILIEQAKARDCYIEVIAVEINGLGTINELFGIQAGNQAIVDIAGMLEGAVENGLFGCLGNDEFLIAMLVEEEQTNDLDKIRDYMEEQLTVYNTEIGADRKLSVTLGSHSSMVVSIEGLEQLVNAAVSCKNGNKKNSQWHNLGALTEAELKEAEIALSVLDKNRFSYHFQPIVDAKNGEIFAYEALMRGDVEPYISPLIILKYAEHFGRLYDVERATFFNVLHYIDEHEELFQGRKVFVNSIPGKRLQGEDAFSVQGRLQERNGMIVVELTEQTELDDASLSAMKEEYEQIGVEIAIDDYGTGYSNISNLLRYMPKYVKIDKMLLTGIQNSPQKQHFVRDIIEFAHGNDILVLAEGVETSEELKEVIRLGTDLIQGFYTAKPSPVPIDAIHTTVQNEIIQFKQMALAGKGGKIYIAGQESKVSLVKLAAQHYGRIQVLHEEFTHRDITIAGVPGFQANMDLAIGDLYTGRIELQDVNLSGAKNQPCIIVGEKCEVTLVLIGENTLESGGIIVPESSILTIQGDGNLYIKKSGVGGYGIGNGKDERHGDLIFEQSGTIEIDGDAMYGVGIGSGMGGNIQIINGKYAIRLNGQMGVGIGALYGDFNNPIRLSAIELHIVNAMNVGIGSLMGNTDIRIDNTSIKGYFGGSKSVGIGSVQGNHCAVEIKESMAKLDMRAENLCGIGNLTGDADIEASAASLYVVGQGKHAIAMGNALQNASICCYNSDLMTDIKSNMETDMGASHIEIVNGRSQFLLNGKEIVRKIVEGDL